MNSLSLTDFPETLLKSFVNVQHLDLDVVEKKIVENFQKGLISEELFNNSLDILEKAGATKYIRREGSPGNYKYIYKEEDGSKKTSQVDKYKIRSVDGKFLLLEDGKALGSYDTYEQAFGAVERITKKESSKKPLKDKDDIFAGNLQDVPKGTRLRDKEGNLYIVTPKTMYGSGDVRDSGDEIRVQYLEDGSTYTTTLSRDFLKEKGITVEPSLKEKEKYLRDHGVFVGGLSDEGIEAHYSEKIKQGIERGGENAKTLKDKGSKEKETKSSELSTKQISSIKEEMATQLENFRPLRFEDSEEVIFDFPDSDKGFSPYISGEEFEKIQSIAKKNSVKVYVFMPGYSGSGISRVVFAKEIPKPQKK